MDFAHTETDKRIEELEKRLQAEYRQAYKETKGKLEKYLSDFARKDEAKRKLVDEGKLTQEKYKEWRTNQMLAGQRWTKMVDTLARDMNRTNQIAADIISGQLSPTFALNANYAAYGIENGFRTDYGFTLYDQETVNRLVAENPDLLPAPSVDIPADIRWNKQKITSNITQAVLQGKSIPEIAKTMQNVVGMNKASATRNARTAMTGAQNAGRQATYDRAKAMGIKVKKEWIATLDGRTRHSHGMADGQQVELDGKFKVGRAKMRYPGDVQNGTPEEIYNCRCTMATVEPPEILQGEQPRMTYQEWYKGKENAENGLKSGGKSGIIKENDKKPIAIISDNSIERVPLAYINGYTDEQCEKIREQHKELLEYSRSKNNNNEVAFVFNADLSARKEYTGSDDTIDFGSDLYGKDLLVLHNHPRNSSYSYRDIVEFFGNDSIKTLSIVKNNGQVETLTKITEYNKLDMLTELQRLQKNNIKTKSDAEYRKIVNKFLKKHNGGVIEWKK